MEKVAGCNKSGFADGAVLEAQFDGETDIRVIDSEQSVYICDHHRIRQIPLPPAFFVPPGMCSLALSSCLVVSCADEN